MPELEDALDPYVKRIVAEARRRGVGVEVLDAEDGYLALELDGTRILTRGALSERTHAVAMSLCANKRLTRKVLSRAGLRVALGRVATFDDADDAFLAEVGELVVKPVDGEQGWGVTVGVRSGEGLARAREVARRVDAEVLLEQRCHGEELRVVVIDHRVVAASVRKPPAVTGDGRSSLRELVERRSAQRAAETDGESHIPMDDHLADTIEEAGDTLEDVLPDGRTLVVRHAANLHAGGTLEDVTATLDPHLAEVCVTASRVLDIPVVGIDLIVPGGAPAEYVIVEANERPGLANHEPQPTHERFLDLLFPETRE